MFLKKGIALSLICLLGFGVMGCSNNSEESKESLKKENGEEIVVATSVAVTEILDELGVKVSGVPTSSYDLPESTKDAVKVGNPMNPDLEIIKSLNPDVVVSVDTLGEDYKKLFTDNNIPSEFIDLTTLEGLKTSISTLGERFNKTEKANEILNELKVKEDEFSNLSKEEKKNVLLVFAAPGSMMIATPSSYIGNLVDKVGANNIVKDDKKPFVSYSNEEIVKLNPDMVLVMTHGMPEQAKKMAEEKFASDPAWSRIEAVKEGKVYYLENGYFGMSANLKVTESLDKLGEIIYGEK
ncbi:MAG: heme ABC transporter substrate-binding protein IsdE [Clostridium perfringens]|uniref:High-affinity heme uptake system protein IsdE n=1 Tax=Clostridium perfringens D str. JGS1721 TaxID=488537 RepID=B1V2F8_CLOPF|nr:heme ABC transporter substrate-binding protein IsdE [Clostridium perfringens]EDT72018.1 putative iron chelate uptake ABC transporter, solute-binding protein [Clostridium perfringens D str. JGS1721]EGT0692959.1 heme ABC transporter substrate-binding protein IsdE [Clostridium perfringens]EHK2346580.1 heme ABC transporter substrate-binding protein IsdE [Clostridium perfringens]ELC8396828.1 heme ABC transporter substrate-binding protein IsdE [Clostridium perfringens]ELC8427582.1 heme ABC transp